MLRIFLLRYLVPVQPPHRCSWKIPPGRGLLWQASSPLRISWHRSGAASEWRSRKQQSLPHSSSDLLVGRGREAYKSVDWHWHWILEEGPLGWVQPVYWTSYSGVAGWCVVLTEACPSMEESFCSCSYSYSCSSIFNKGWVWRHQSACWVHSDRSTDNLSKLQCQVLHSFTPPTPLRTSAD